MACCPTRRTRRRTRWAERFAPDAIWRVLSSHRRTVAVTLFEGSEGVVGVC